MIGIDNAVLATTELEIDHGGPNSFTHPLCGVWLGYGRSFSVVTEPLLNHCESHLYEEVFALSGTHHKIVIGLQRSYI